MQRKNQPPAAGSAQLRALGPCNRRSASRGRRRHCPHTSYKSFPAGADGTNLSEKSRPKRAAHRLRSIRFAHRPPFPYPRWRIIRDWEREELRRRGAAKYAAQKSARRTAASRKLQRSLAKTPCSFRASKRWNPEPAPAGPQPLQDGGVYGISSMHFAWQPSAPPAYAFEPRTRPTASAARRPARPRKAFRPACFSQHGTRRHTPSARL